MEPSPPSSRSPPPPPSPPPTVDEVTTPPTELITDRALPSPTADQPVEFISERSVSPVADNLIIEPMEPTTSRSRSPSPSPSHATVEPVVRALEPLSTSTPSPTASVSKVQPMEPSAVTRQPPTPTSRSRSTPTPTPTSALAPSTSSLSGADLYNQQIGRLRDTLLQRHSGVAKARAVVKQV
jgi:hypothetical protein